MMNLEGPMNQSTKPPTDETAKKGCELVRISHGESAVLSISKLNGPTIDPITLRISVSRNNDNTWSLIFKKDGRDPETIKDTRLDSNNHVLQIAIKGCIHLREPEKPFLDLTEIIPPDWIDTLADLRMNRVGVVEATPQDVIILTQSPTASLAIPKTDMKT